jgi:hypothetical protein
MACSTFDIHRWPLTPQVGFFFPPFLFYFSLESLGWEYGPVQSIPVDAYEIKKMPPRTDKNLILSRQEREEILIAWGASFHDIIEAIRSNVKVKNQRRRTVNAIGTYDRWEEAMEAASRKIKKSLIFTKKQPQSHHQHQQNSQQQAYSEFWYGQSNPPSSSSSNSNNNNNHHHHHHRRSDILRPPTRTVCHEDDDDVVVAAGDDHNNKQNDSGQHNSQQSLSPPDRKQKVATDTNATTTTSMPKNNINNLKQPEEKEENMVKSDNNNSNHHNLGNVVQVVVDVIPMRPRRRDSKESEPEKQRQIQQAAQQQQQSNHPYMVVDMDKSIASSTLGRDHTEEDNKSQQSGDTFPEGVDAISTLDDEEDSFTTTSYQNNHHHRYNFDEYDVDDDFDALSSLLSESDRYPTEHTFEEIMILESFVESQMHNNNNPHLNSSDRERALLEHAMMIQMNIPPELEDIERDFSHWTIESGHGYPKLQKLIRPVTISEDHPFAEREPSKTTTTTTTTTTEPSPRTTAQPATALTPPFFNHPSHPDIPSSTLLHAPSFPPLSSSSVGATALVPPDDEYRPNWNGLEIEETPSSTENDPCCWDDFGQRMDGFHAMPPPPNSMNLIAKWS